MRKFVAGMNQQSHSAHLARLSTFVLKVAIRHNSVQITNA